MYSHTKKVGSLGRYGTRVGGRIRKEVKRIEDISRAQRKCPRCSRKIKRESSGVWKCSFCGFKFAGGAYIPITKKKIVGG